MTSLRGIFPEPKKPPKRNFLRENMVNIKQKEMAIKAFQAGYIQGLNADLPVNKRHESKRSNKVITAEKPKIVTVDNSQISSRTCCQTAVESALKNVVKHKPKYRDVGIQATESLSPKQFQNFSTMPEGDTPILHVQTKQRPRLLNEQPESISKKDFIKENAQAIKSNKNLQKNSLGAANPPPDYKRGVVPQYIKDRKEELYKQAKSTEGDEKCPEGHVMLPDNERKETLRMLRQSYVDLITELNNLPVRSDTLKVRNRKIDIEKQLKKLEEGIKVFTRPKVYVKIGA